MYPLYLHKLSQKKKKRKKDIATDLFAYHIETSLKESGKDPVIHLETSFDQITFNGGLKQSGILL